MNYNELEYKGLNLMDKVGTVELAINADLKVIHVFDTQQIVDPEYDFQTKNYRLSDGFFKMAHVLMQKSFLEKSIEEPLHSWVDSITWFFYGSKNAVKAYKNKVMLVVPFSEFTHLNEQQLIDKSYYPKYVSRLLSE
ncbi:aminopeptidase [Solibacillus sp. R5-41]|uniref:aminopeptidase n=1 Tax=Solibacillus sp. R5-41 TaxID=2048654 RepID=UPI000C126739|nr:aminopeptidase [Solibacillus sp. R5-41]ATP41102.1 aminopeptidase [Solibacillus sp. R5-41]